MARKVWSDSCTLRTQAMLTLYLGCNPGYEAIRVSYGPMGRYGSFCRNLIGFAQQDDRSVKDCELFCRVVFGQQDGAHQTVPLPFRPVELPKKLKFGYYSSGKALLISHYP